MGDITITNPSYPSIFGYFQGISLYLQLIGAHLVPTVSRTNVTMCVSLLHVYFTVLRQKTNKMMPLLLGWGAQLYDYHDQQELVLLLMEEILHHLGCINFVINM